MIWSGPPAYMISIILQNQIQAFATSCPSHSSIVLQIGLTTRDGEEKKDEMKKQRNTTDGLKQRTEEIVLFSKEKKRYRIRLSPGCRQCWLHNLQLHPSPSDHHRLTWSLCGNSGQILAGRIHTVLSRLLFSNRLCLVVSYLLLVVKNVVDSDAVKDDVVGPWELPCILP